MWVSYLAPRTWWDSRKRELPKKSGRKHKVKREKQHPNEAHHQYSHVAVVTFVAVLPCVLKAMRKAGHLKLTTTGINAMDTVCYCKSKGPAYCKSRLFWWDFILGTSMQISSQFREILILVHHQYCWHHKLYFLWHPQSGTCFLPIVCSEPFFSFEHLWELFLSFKNK